MQCSVCGNSVPFDFRFCPYCGNKLYELGLSLNPATTVAGRNVRNLVLDIHSHGITVDSCELMLPDRNVEGAINGGTVTWAGVGIAVGNSYNIRVKYSRIIGRVNGRNITVTFEEELQIEIPAGGVTLKNAYEIDNMLYVQLDAYNITNVSLAGQNCQRVDNSNWWSCPIDNQNVNHISLSVNTDNGMVIIRPANIKQLPDFDVYPVKGIRLQQDGITMPESMKVKLHIRFPVNLNSAPLPSVQNDTLLYQEANNHIDGNMDVISEENDIELSQSLDNTFRVKRKVVSVNSVNGRGGEAYIAIDFGNTRSTMGVFIHGDGGGAIHKPTINGADYIMESRAYNSAPSCTGNCNNKDRYMFSYYYHFDQPVVLTGVKNRIMHQIAQKHGNNLKSYAVRIISELLFTGLYLIYNNGRIGTDIFQNLKGIVLSYPPTWPEDYQKELKSIVRDAFSAVLKGNLPDNIEFDFVHESFAPLMWALRGGAGGHDAALVVDFGGGTTDVAFYDLKGAAATLYAFASGKAGGDNLDVYLARNFLGNDNIESIFNIRKEKEQNNGFPQKGQGVFDGNYGDVNQEVKSIIENITEVLLNQIKMALDNQKYKYDDKSVLLVLAGGLSRMRHPDVKSIVENKVRSVFGVKNVGVSVVGKMGTVQGMLRWKGAGGGAMNKVDGIAYYNYITLGAGGANISYVKKKGEGFTGQCEENWKKIIDDLLYYPQGPVPQIVIDVVGSVFVPNGGIFVPIGFIDC